MPNLFMIVFGGGGRRGVLNQVVPVLDPHRRDHTGDLLYFLFSTPAPSVPGADV